MATGAGVSEACMCLLSDRASILSVTNSYSYFVSYSVVAYDVKKLAKSPVRVSGPRIVFSLI